MTRPTAKAAAARSTGAKRTAGSGRAETGPSQHDRLVAATLDLVASSGYHGVGINHVLERAEVGNGSLYHAFPEGKAALVAAALRSEADRSAAIISAALTRGTDAALDVMFGGAARELVATGFSHGCRVTTALADANAVEPVRRAGVDALERWTTIITEHVRAQGASPTDAAAAAEASIALYVGAWITARTSRSTASMHAARTAAGAVIRSAVSGDLDGRTPGG